MNHQIVVNIAADFSHPDDARRAITRALVSALQPPLVTSWYTLEVIPFIDAQRHRFEVEQ
jgi:hypothetical protein|tara:strand:+ start:3431 stop:3610 length:180 start_codon:yes stop_codon:yes gene_type:complete